MRRSCSFWLFVAASASAYGEEIKQPTDVGLAQSLRQQIASDCYGFVEHSTSQIRGFSVGESFQLLRDGYPWAHFETTANLMVDRQEILVGGPGQGCAFTPPGGLVNLVTRRADNADQPRGNILLEADHFGTMAVRVEQVFNPREDIGLRLAARQERFRNSAKDTEDSGDLALNLDYQLTDNTKIRWDLEFTQADLNNGLGEPALFSQPQTINRNISREQPWARYKYDSVGSLLALEHLISDQTLFKAGISNVRYSGDYHSLYLEPQVAGQPLLVDYVYPDQDYRFDAFQAELSRKVITGEIQHGLRVAYTNLNVAMPDQVRPEQILGLYTPGQIFPQVPALPATAARTLKSTENRLTLQDSLHWRNWTARLGLQYAELTDDNGTVKQSFSKWLPVTSLTWDVTPELQLLATKSQGATGRQFASITSSMPNNIQGIGISDELELGLRYKVRHWELGVGHFDLTRPYQFQQQTVTVWRGEQRHRGWESTLQWTTPDELGHMVFTTQWIKAQVTGTGDPTLDGKLPPGIPAQRGSLYADYRLGAGSPWVASISAEALSKRATFDDNAVFVSGYTNWSAGLEWQGYDRFKNTNIQLTLQNLANRFAWSEAGGGYAVPLDERTLAISMRIGL